MTDGGCLAPLHHAAICADGETCLEVLLQARACVNQLDHQKMTPLHHAALRGHRNHAQILLEARHQQCLVNLDDWTCKTPLHHAAMLGRENILALLLKHNANIHMTDGDCLAPLHHAAICADGETCLEVLLQARACVNSWTTKRFR